MIEVLPRQIRSGAFGTAYVIAIALFGGTTPLVITWLIHLTGSAIAPAWYLIAFTAVGQFAYMLFPETAPVRVGPIADVSDVTNSGSQFGKNFGAIDSRD